MPIGWRTYDGTRAPARTSARGAARTTDSHSHSGRHRAARLTQDFPLVWGHADCFLRGVSTDSLTKLLGREPYSIEQTIANHRTKFIDAFAKRAAATKAAAADAKHDEL